MQRGDASEWVKIRYTCQYHWKRILFLAAQVVACLLPLRGWAAATIHRITSSWPMLFAYPYGEASDYLQEDYFPHFPGEHRTRAAVTTEPALVTHDASPWSLPRYVYGAHWQTAAELQKILADVR